MHAESIGCPRKSAGFTLIESLVAVAIIGIVIGLVVPAVMMVRESARKAACSNRLRQIGIALNGHQSAAGRYTVPSPARYRSEGMTFGSNTGMSGYYELLPYLELTPLYNAINFGGIGTLAPIGIAVEGPQNATAYHTRVAQFVCPSDGMTSDGATGMVSYRFNLGSSHPGIVPSGMKLGAFDVIKPATPADISDGLSQTAGFSERLVGSQVEGSFDRRRDLWATGVLGVFTFETDDDVHRLCGSLTGIPAESITRMGRTWMMAGGSYVWYNHVGTPNDRVCDCAASIAGSTAVDWCEYCSIAARSWHSGGVHCLLMDGSVRFVRDGINKSVWRGVGSRAGGEVITIED